MRLLEAAIIIALAAYLVNLAARFIAEVWPVIVAVIAIMAIAAIAYRIWKNHTSI